jgi:pimeloyl-ACP methyl ester carboxylesterase
MRTQRTVGLGAFVTLFATGLAFVACGDDELTPALRDAGADAPNEAASFEGGKDSAAEAGGITFQGCPGAFSGECATLSVPLDWSNPSGQKIDLFIDKIASSIHPRAQVWVLQGGPGGTAADVVPIGAEIANRVDDVEVFTIEHRGVGYSDRLGCPQEDALADAGTPSDAGGGNPSDGSDDGAADDGAFDAGLVDAAPPDSFDYHGCIASLQAKWGSGLAQFNITNAAKDLEYAIAVTREPNEQSMVYGVSYGTLWAQRYLQVAPTQSSGVILDSIVAPDALFLSNFDPQPDVQAQKLADLCKMDASCTAALGADPWARIEDIKAQVDHGFCQEAVPNPRDRVMITSLLRNWQLMPYAFAVWARIGRCSAADVTAIRQIAARLASPQPTASLESGVLGWNIMFPEMWESPAPSKATLEARFANTVFPAGGIDTLCDVRDAWPLYSLDAFAHEYASSTTPMLMLNGTLDSQTPIEISGAVKTHYTAPNQTFVTIPNANHGTVTQSPLAQAPGVPSTPFTTCGMELVAQFVKDPKASLDTSCLGKLATVSFTRPADEIAYLFGTSDLWLGVRVPEAPMPSSLAEQLRMRRLWDRPTPRVRH